MHSEQRLNTSRFENAKDALTLLEKSFLPHTRPSALSSGHAAALALELLSSLPHSAISDPLTTDLPLISTCSSPHHIACRPPQSGGAIPPRLFRSQIFRPFLLASTAPSTAWIILRHTSLFNSVSSPRSFAAQNVPRTQCPLLRSVLHTAVCRSNASVFSFWSHGQATPERSACGLRHPDGKV